MSSAKLRGGDFDQADLAVTVQRVAGGEGCSADGGEGPAGPVVSFTA